MPESYVDRALLATLAVVLVSPLVTGAALLAADGVRAAKARVTSS